jgi:hypothetical protein
VKRAARPEHRPTAQQAWAKPSQEVTVFTARRINRPAITCALACALLASAMSGTAAARPHQHTKASAALAQEHYYASYGDPAPVVASQPPAPSDDTPWRLIALSSAAALVIAAATASQLRRLRIRQRGATQART